MNLNIKEWLASKTFWGIVAGLIVLVGRIVWKKEFDQGEISDALTLVAGGIAALVAGFGRKTAKGPIGASNPPQ